MYLSCIGWCLVTFEKYRGTQVTEQRISLGSKCILLQGNPYEYSPRAEENPGKGS